MKRFLNSFIILFLTSAFFCSSTALAQKKDSSNLSKKKDTLRIFYTNEEAFENLNVSDFYTRIDTSLTGIQKFELLNSDIPFAAKFSNTGLAYRNLDFDEKYNFDFTSSKQYFKDYFLTNENAKYFSASTPFTDLYYVKGSKLEQLFNVFFTRNFKKNLNLSAKYKLIHSPGKYANQKSDDSFVLLTGNYHTKRNKYSVIGDYFFNRMKMQENGGILHDSDFINNLYSNKQLDSIKLDSAFSVVKESGFYIRQFYFLGFFYKNNNDSMKVRQNIPGFGCLSHSLLFKNQSYTYIDGNPMSGFYPVTLLNNTLTHDSIHIRTIENNLTWANVKYLNPANWQHFLLQIALKYKYSKLFGNSVDTALSSWIPQAKLRLRIGKDIEVASNGFYYLKGYDKGDFSATGSVTYRYDSDTVKTGYIGFKADIIQQSPAFFDLQYSSNNFFWKYSFNPTFTKKAGLFCNYKTLNISLNYFLIKDYIYYDNFARPKQYNDYLEVVQLELDKNFKWKSLELDNKILFQKTYNADLIRIPDICSNHAFYFNSHLFKNALIAQLGFEVTFFSSYYPQAWMPATKEFYLQNDYKSGNYPYIDLFFNMKIKKASIYIKMDHINSGFMGYDYFMIPHYPMSDRAFKFGVSWMFYN